MKNIVLLLISVALTSVSGLVSADVNISSPSNNSTIKNPASIRFKNTCATNTAKLYWLIDGAEVGRGSFNSRASFNFAYQLPAGPHNVKVMSDCGSDTVNFNVH